MEEGKKRNKEGTKKGRRRMWYKEVEEETGSRRQDEG